MNDFDSKAKGWDADQAKVERARAVADAIRDRVPMKQHMAALEYGCGTGLLSFALHPYLDSITLADSSTGMLEVLADKIANAGILNMTPVRLDLTSDPLLDYRYGLIYSLMTLHHIPDYEQLLNTFHALLEPGGYLCIADLDKEEDANYHGEGFHGHHGFDRYELKKKLEDAGFVKIGFSTVYEMVRETANGKKSFPLFLMVAQAGQVPVERH